jgi:hypothetical protein
MVIGGPCLGVLSALLSSLGVIAINRFRRDRKSVKTSTLIARAERDVGAALVSELNDHLKLARDLTDLAGVIVERVENAPGDPRALHVCATLISRLINDLQACMHLVAKGYVTQLLSLTAGMLEIAHTSMFIGSMEDRAERWITHDEQASTPWSVYDMVQAVSKAVGADEDATRREYEKIYRQSKMANHANPMAFSEVGVHVEGDSIYLLSMPYLSPAVRRWAHVGMQLAVRYTYLAALKFVGDHLGSDPQAPTFVENLKVLSTRMHAVIAADRALFSMPPKNRD